MRRQNKCCCFKKILWALSVNFAYKLPHYEKFYTLNVCFYVAFVFFMQKMLRLLETGRCRGKRLQRPQNGKI
jgi:hypothetical protein